MTKVRAVALDIDGTLTNSDSRVSTEVLDAVRGVQSQGIAVVLVSARPPQGVDAIARQLYEPVYRICYMGALIQKPSGEDIVRCNIERHVAEDIAAFADRSRISLTISINDI